MGRRRRAERVEAHKQVVVAENDERDDPKQGGISFVKNR